MYSKRGKLRKFNVRYLVISRFFHIFAHMNKEDKRKALKHLRQFLKKRGLTGRYIKATYDCKTCFYGGFRYMDNIQRNGKDAEYSDIFGAFFTFCGQYGVSWFREWDEYKRYINNLRENDRG